MDAPEGTEEQGVRQGQVSMVSTDISHMMCLLCRIMHVDTGMMTLFICHMMVFLYGFSIGYRMVRGGGGARNMKYMGPPVAAIFFMTSFNRDRGGGGMAPLAPPLDPQLGLYMPERSSVVKAWDF